MYEAPGLFSTTKGTPICVESCCVITRMRTSGEPPAAEGMTKRIGFSGYAASSVPLTSHESRKNALRTLERFGRVHGEVSEDAIGAGALEREQRFEHARLWQPAIVDRAAQHRVFARHLVDVRRRLELLLHTAHDIEVGHSRLDHYHVGALGEIEPHFPQRLVGVRRIHLVGLLVALAEALRRAHRLAKGTVEAGGILRRVRHD